MRINKANIQHNNKKLTRHYTTIRYAKYLNGKYTNESTCWRESVGEAHSHRKRETDRTAASARGSEVRVPRLSRVSNSALDTISENNVHRGKK